MSLEDKLRNLIREKRQKYDELQQEAEDCWDKEWYEGHERLLDEARITRAEYNVLVSLLDN